MWKVSVVLCALVVVTFAAQAIEPLAPIPEKFKTREGCYIKEHDKLLKVEESISSKKSCTLFTCAKQYVTISGCPVAVPKPPCKLTAAALDKPYPRCCPKISCP